MAGAGLYLTTIQRNPRGYMVWGWWNSACLASVRTQRRCRFCSLLRACLQVKQQWSSVPLGPSDDMPTRKFVNKNTWAPVKITLSFSFHYLTLPQGCRNLRRKKFCYCCYAAPTKLNVYIRYSFRYRLLTVPELDGPGGSGRENAISLSPASVHASNQGELVQHSLEWE